MIVTANNVISLRFTIKNNRGEIVEDIMTSTPIDYLNGSGSILPALEAGIEGLQAGDQKSLVFSDPNLDGGENYNIDVVIDHIREATAAELQMGRPEPKAADKECGPGCCC